jgi:hypothetical protein
MICRNETIRRAKVQAQIKERTKDGMTKDKKKKECNRRQSTHK